MRLKVLLITALAALCACSQSQPTTGAAQKTPIRFATDWRAEAEHGGFYEALATGEYARRGLDVRIIQGGPTVNVPELVASGAVELGDGSNSFIVMNLANAGAPVKAVAAFMQKDPQVLLAHPDAGIKSLADMKGHPILLSDASKTAFWPWLKKRYGFSDDQVRSYDFNNSTFILNKNVVQEGYLTSEPYTIQKAAGFAPTVFLLADQGYPSYAAMVLAPTSLISRNPAAIRAFIEASAVGWKNYLYGDPKPADALIMKDNPNMTEDVLAQARDKMRAYHLVDGGDAGALGIGAMTDQHWSDFFKLASDKGAPNYKNAFSLDFLPKAPVK
ncbi:MAG TPA: ABC transporter substrate-binding protein [Caulobacteraceae bacterium]|jgi:NitT/TauT family transport system substrate-binding protein|nr:ABC transporter substrate-binding protein [Caulobacteraceae bacterium]